MKNNGEQRRKPKKMSLISTPISKVRIATSSIINKSFKCKSSSSHEAKNPPSMLCSKNSNSHAKGMLDESEDLSKAETMRIVPEQLNNKVSKESPQFSEISVQSSIQSKFTSHSYIKFTVKPLKSLDSIINMKQHALLNLFSFFTNLEQIKLLKIECIFSARINSIIQDNSIKLLNSFFNLYQGSLNYSACYLKEGLNSLNFIVKADLCSSIYTKKDPFIISFRYFYESKDIHYSNKFYLSLSHEGITSTRGKKNGVTVLSNLIDNECNTSSSVSLQKGKISSCFYKRLNQIYCHGLSDLRKGSQVYLNFAFNLIHKDYGFCKFIRIEFDSSAECFCNSSLEEEKSILGIHNLCWKEPRLIKNGRFQSLCSYFSKFFIIKSISYEFSKYYIFKIALEFSEDYLVNFLMSFTKDEKEEIQTDFQSKKVNTLLSCFAPSNTNSEIETHRLMLLTKMTILSEKHFTFKDRELTILKSKYVNSEMKFKLFNNSMFSTHKDVYSIVVESIPTLKDMDTDSNDLDSSTFIYLQDAQRLTFYLRELNI